MRRSPLLFWALDIIFDEAYSVFDSTFSCKALSRLCVNLVSGLMGLCTLFDCTQSKLNVKICGILVVTVFVFVVPSFHRRYIWMDSVPYQMVTFFCLVDMSIFSMLGSSAALLLYFWFWKSRCFICANLCFWAVPQMVLFTVDYKVDYGLFRFRYFYC